MSAATDRGSAGYATGARATAFAPASIGNVGPGFDVLGLAVDGLGDRVTIELAGHGDDQVVVVGRDAALVPATADRNCAAIAARAYLRACGRGDAVVVTVDKGLAASGGMGGSAASSVAGAWAAHLAVMAERSVAGEVTTSGASTAGTPFAEVARDADSATRDRVLAAALAGESAVAGCHLDNIAPSLLGGLALVRATDPPDVVALPVAADWWVALVTPRVRIATRDARAILPAESDRATWVQQMANTAAVVHAFAVGDGDLLSRALDDRFAEPRRAALIPNFAAVKAAALALGAFGAAISGSGPTIFAVAPDEAVAWRCGAAMRDAFGEVPSTIHLGAIARQGARRA